MSALPATHHVASEAARPWDGPRRIAVVRAILALAWAAALVVAVRHRVPSTHTDLRFAAAALLTTYPVIDVVASIVGASSGAAVPARLLRINAAISAVAVVALAVTAFGSDAGSVLAAFGAWAVVSGVLQLVVALRRRRSSGWQVPILISGGLSTFAGIGFLAASRDDAAHLGKIAGYMAFGAVLFLFSALRVRRSAKVSD
jgi:uncharacterized membrane protein HdeD (DUF308 family)